MDFKSPSNSNSNSDVHQLPPYMRPYSYPSGGYGYFSYSYSVPPAPVNSSEIDAEPQTSGRTITRMAATGPALPTYCPPPPPPIFRPVDFEAPASSRSMQGSSSGRLLVTPSYACSLEEDDCSVQKKGGTCSVIGKDSTYCNDGITVYLQEADLWNSFNSAGNEMIVTKPGRRLFPSLLVSVRGLKVHVNYTISLHIKPADNYRYKYIGMRWVAMGESEVMQDESRQIYQHPNSPKTGEFWMKKPISFKPCKITHNTHSKHGNILLHTMHKYVMEIIVTAQGGDETAIPLTATEFITVTAYQNTQLTLLKINHNPFAKGFRERDYPPCYHDNSLIRISPASSTTWGHQLMPNFKQKLPSVGSLTSGDSSHSRTPGPEYMPITYQYSLPQDESLTENNGHPHDQLTSP